MVDILYTAPLKPGEPSPWWLKGGAIFIGILGLASLIGAISFVASGWMMESMFNELNSEEMCQDDPDTDACEELIDLISEMAEMRLWDIGAATSAFLFLISIPTAMIMWTAEDRDMSLKLAWTWIAVHAASQLYIMHEFMKWMGEFYDFIPEELSWVRIFSVGMSYGSVITCEFTLAGGLALISYQTRPPTAIELPSGFHQDPPPET